jgi:2-methylcitrate dehydratase PrpD
MQFTRKLAEFITQPRGAVLPAPVMHASKRLILDTLGCMMGAVDTIPGHAVREITRLAGNGAATVVGTGQRCSPLAAAYANGRLGNILDIDECYMVQGHHAQAVLGAALALCQQGRLGGPDLIEAFAIGFEVGVRIGNYFNPQVTVGDDGKAKGWTGLVGPGQGVYAACAASARLLGLSVDQTVHALSLCPQYMVHRDWSRQWGKDLALGTIKYADTGWNAQAGMMAALSAKGGVTGMCDVFDSGRFEAVFPAISFRPEALVSSLGETWSVPNTSFKFWPCCRWIHYALTAFSELVHEYDLRGDEISRIQLRSFPLIPYPRFASTEDPANLVAATFSFAHAAAMVAMRVPAGPAWFNESAMHGRQARNLRGIVELGHEPAGESPERWGLQEGELRVPSRAVIHARGRVFEATCDYALGDPWAGAPSFGDAEIRAKFMVLAEALSPGETAWQIQTAALADSVFALEDVSDVNALVTATMPSHRENTKSSA